MFQSLWDAVKAVLREKYGAIQAYLKKQEKSQKQPNLTPEGARERTTKPKSSRRKEIIKIKAETNDIEIFKNNRMDQ